MATTKKLTKQERLQMLRDKLKKTDVGGGGKGWWSPKQGRNVIRILPEVGEMAFFFQEVGKHNFPDGRTLYCPKFTSSGEKDCPVCELIDELYADGTPASKKLAKSLGLRRAYWMNVVDRGDEDAGVRIFTPGVGIFRDLQSMISDPDYGDITDLDEGLDIIIEREGTGLSTEYNVKAKRTSTALSDDAEQADKWMEDAKDLSWVEVSEDEEEDKELAGDHALFVLPYNRIVKEFGLEDLDVDDMASQVKADSDDAPAAKTERKATSKKVAVPEKDLDEDEDEAEEEDEDEAPAKEAERRIARRSRRR